MIARLGLIAALIFLPSQVMAGAPLSSFTAPNGVTQIAPYPALNYVTPQMFGAKCDGSTDDRSAFNSANTAANSFGSTLLVQKSSAACVIGSSLTISAPVQFVSGGILKPSSGSVTVSFTGPLTAPVAQLFDISGGGLIRGTFQTPKIYVQWFNSNASNTARHDAFQAALNTAAANTSQRNMTVSLCGADVADIFNIGAHGVTASGNDLPNIEGCAPASMATADSINLVMAPSTSEASITLSSNGNPCGCSVKGIFFDGNANTIGVDVASTISARLENNAGSGTIGIFFRLHNINSSFSEQTIISNNLMAGIGASALFVDFFPDGGTNSFAGTQFSGMNYVSASAARTLPIIRVQSGAFVYNSCLNINVHNNSAGAFYVVDNQQAPPLFFSCGTIQLEGDNTNTIGIANPAHNRIYLGSTAVTEQGFNNADLSAVSFCRNFWFLSVANCTGGTAYQLVTTGAGNTTIGIPGVLGGPYQTYNVNVSNADNTYEYLASVAATFDGSGAATANGGALIHDTHSYLAPTFSVSGGQLKVSNANWPSGTITITYSQTAP